jgi:hypothetical protein
MTRYLAITIWHLRSCFLWGALSDERTGLPFVYAAGSSKRSLSRVRVPWYSRPYFTVSDLRLPFSSPLTTRRVTLEVFDPASTRVSHCQWITCPFMILCGPQTEHTLALFVWCYLPIRCDGNGCSPKTVVKQRYIPRCHENVFSEAPPSRLLYCGFQASRQNSLIR